MVQFVHRALIKPGGKRVVQNSFLQRTWVRVGRKDKEAQRAARTAPEATGGGHAIVPRLYAQRR